MRNKKCFQTVVLICGFFMVNTAVVFAQTIPITVTSQRTQTIISGGMGSTREFFKRMSARSSFVAQKLRDLNKQNIQRLRDLREHIAQRQMQMRDLRKAARDRVRAVNEMAKDRTEQNKTQQQRNRDLIEAQKARIAHLREVQRSMSGRRF